MSDPKEDDTEPGGAGRGGIVSPGGTQPKPTEDPRKDSGLHDAPPAPNQDLPKE
jgi:hypothetical protein